MYQMEQKREQVLNEVSARYLGEGQEEEKET